MLCLHVSERVVGITADLSVDKKHSELLITQVALIKNLHV